MAIGDVRVFIADDYVNLWPSSVLGRPTWKIYRHEALEIAELLLSWAMEDVE